MLYPYSKTENFIENTINFPSFLNNTELENFESSNFKIFSFLIPPKIMYFSLDIEVNECYKLESFISKNGTIDYQIEKDYGNTVVLNLSSIMHDLSLEEVKKGLDLYPEGSFYDFTNRILNFRLAFNYFEEPVKLNFFCPYWKEKYNTNKFKGNVNLLWDDTNYVSNTGEKLGTYEDNYKFWSTMEPNMMLNEIRLNASEMDDVFETQYFLDQTSDENVKDVSKFFF